MKAGELDRRVVVQRFTSMNSPSGEQVQTWAAVGPARWASMNALAGIERFGSAQLEASEQVEFHLRWAADLADLSPADRLIEPATAAVEPIAERSIYDVFAVLEIGRHEGLRVLATRRPAVRTNTATAGVITAATGAAGGSGSAG